MIRRPDGQPAQLSTPAPGGGAARRAGGRGDAESPPLPRAKEPFVPRRRRSVRPPVEAGGAVPPPPRGGAPVARVGVGAGTAVRSAVPPGAASAAGLRHLGDQVAYVQTPRMARLLELARARLAGATALPACQPGARMVDQDGEAGRYTLSAAHALRPLPVASLLHQRRETSLDSHRLESILQGLADGNDLPPLRVTAAGQVSNGFHRLAVAALLGLRELTAEVPRA